MGRTQLLSLACAFFWTLTASGCNGDVAATRTLRIHQLQSTGQTQRAFIVDTSQLPPGSVRRNEEKEGRWGPITDIQLDMSQVKIMIVPASQPSERPIPVPAGMERRDLLPKPYLIPPP